MKFIEYFYCIISREGLFIVEIRLILLGLVFSKEGFYVVVFLYIVIFCDDFFDKDFDNVYVFYR